MPKKTSTYQQVLLFLEILKLIPRYRKISQKELLYSLQLRGFDVDAQKLQRALKQMCECESFDIECDQRNRPYGYRLTGPQAFSQAKLNVQESLLLLLVKAHLTHQLPGSLNAALSPLYDAARQVLDDKGNAQRARSWLKKVAVVPNHLPFVPPDIKPSVFNAVSDGLYRDLMLHLTYHRPNKGLKTYEVSPLGLVQQDVRLYLVCAVAGKEKLRHFALHRIQDADIMDRPTTSPKDFDLSTYLEEVPFNYTFKPTRRIHLMFEMTNPHSVNNLRETPLDRTQSITEIKPGLWRIEADVLDSMLLDGWIATWQAESGIQRVHKDPLS